MRVGTIAAAVHRQCTVLPPLRRAREGHTGAKPFAAAATWEELPVGGSWGGYDRTIRLHGEIAIPSAWAGEGEGLSAR